MIVYKNYDSLVESPLLDRYILSLGKNSAVTIFLLLLLGGPFRSILPILSLFIRPYITDQYIKRLFNWITLFWVWASGAWAWVTILLTIETIRETFRFGVPRILGRISNRIETDPVTETLFRKLCGFLRRANRQNVGTILLELYSSVVSFSHGDSSGAFDENEKQKFRKFFTDFPKTCFILDEERRSVTIFFPSFVMRLSFQGLQITSDEAIKLIRSAEDPEKIDELPKLPSAKPIGEEDIKSTDPCAICRDKLGDIAVKLKCNHQYCLNCIFTWLNRQYVCPLCRGEVN